MAVIANSTEMDLIYKVQTGSTEDGSPTFSSRTIQNVNPEIADMDAYNVAQSIADLQIYTLGQVTKRTDVELINQE